MSKISLIENEIARIEDTASARQKEAAKLLIAASHGDQKAKFALMEGISTSDIPTVLTPAINVIFLAQYAAMPTMWDQIAERYTVDNYGPIRFGDFDVDASSIVSGGGEEFIAGGLPSVGEYDEYPAVKFTTTQLDKSLEGKNGVRARLSWETLRRTGNFDIISQFTQKFATYAAQQEDIVLAKQFVTTTSGTANSTNWTGRGITANTQLGTTANPVISFNALDAAVAQSRLVKVNGNPVTASRYKLVYGQGLATTVANLLSTTEIRRTTGNDVAIFNPQVTMSQFTPIQFSMMDTVSKGTTDKFWFVLPENTPRPQFLEVFLSGAETPMISVKDSGQFMLSGGAVPFREGSFEEDDIQTRVRHVVDAVAVDLSGSVYSTGAGS
jgi:hypothetical protein